MNKMSFGLPKPMWVGVPGCVRCPMRTVEVVEVSQDGTVTVPGHPLLTGLLTVYQRNAVRRAVRRQHPGWFL